MLFFMFPITHFVQAVRNCHLIILKMVYPLELIRSLLFNLAWVKQLVNICNFDLSVWGAVVAQWLRCCATSQVAGSISADVSGFFIDIKSFRSHYGPGVDSACNRNEYQEYFLRVKAADA